VACRCDKWPFAHIHADDRRQWERIENVETPGQAQRLARVTDEQAQSKLFRMEEEPPEPDEYE
jgi:predicted NAD-dependent protein-ADP-ribosyltransferase YbiA (DUF1768 family)